MTEQCAEPLDELSAIEEAVAEITRLRALLVEVIRIFVLQHADIVAADDS